MIKFHSCRYGNILIKSCIITCVDKKMVDEMPHAIFFDSPLRSYYEFINTFNIAVIDVIEYASNTL